MYPNSRRRPDGREIFYLGVDRRLMAAEVSAKGATLEVGAVRALFGLLAIGSTDRYDVSADGQRILAFTLPEQSAAAPLTLVQNWPAALRR